MIYSLSFQGCSGLFDLGPIGCSIQNNLLNEWRKHFILKDRMMEIDCPILTPEAVLKASGHLSKFSDIMVKISRPKKVYFESKLLLKFLKVKDEITNESFRVDHLITKQLEILLKKKEKENNNTELKDYLKRIKNSQINSLSEIDQLIEKFDIKSPVGNKLTNAVEFNLMFRTQFGPTGHLRRLGGIYS